MTQIFPMTICGWIALDKPYGMSSAHAVAAVKRMLGGKRYAPKIGHAGTLDPLATGVLPLAIGATTRLVSFAQDGAKCYQFSVKFGQSTSTDDAEGEVMSTCEHIPTLPEINTVLPQFIGEITQRPPLYSAVHIGGERAYKQARAGTLQEESMPLRQVTVTGLHCLSGPNNEGIATFEVHCGKGVYVRSLARDIATTLGSLGHVVRLQRTQVGKFLLQDTISLAKLEEIVHTPAIVKAVFAMEYVLDDILVYPVSLEEAEQLRHGRAVMCAPLRCASLTDTPCARAMLQDRLIALGPIQAGRFSPVRVFNL
jgi:tRNA pseudouridine55 synthase